MILNCGVITNPSGYDTFCHFTATLVVYVTITYGSKWVFACAMSFSNISLRPPLAGLQGEQQGLGWRTDQFQAGASGPLMGVSN